ncbi:MAG: hypothetical protein GY854_21505 [Deltaproteobacteria bacterium]|nr:hypothetical protein [Deltaproteobacteria bacterium]
MKHFAEIPEEVYGICRTLKDNGERAYVVGGAVRDLLAGRPGSDIDLATTATPQKVTRLFRKVVPTGMKHGTVTILCEKGKYEITTLRGEGTYTDGRHPDQVEFLNDINADLARRDFTVNAMAWDPISEILYDPFDGRVDLKNRIIRAVGEATERFAEDGLRVLRAARFAATLEFEVEEETLGAMPVAAPALKGVSAERKRDEITRMLGAGNPSRGIILMKRAQLLPYLSTDLADLAGRSEQAWQRTLNRVDALPARLHLRLAGLLLDTGDSETSSKKGPERARIARAWLSDMRFEKKIVESVSHLIAEYEFTGFPDWSATEVRRFMRRVGRGPVFDLLELKRCDLSLQTESKEDLAALDRLAVQVRHTDKSGVPLSVKELPVDGRELMGALSLDPGPQVGRLLEALLEHVLSNPDENNKARLLDVAKNLKDTI